MMKALTYTENGTLECIQCEYMNVCEADELLRWEAENSETIDRWLRFRGITSCKKGSPLVVVDILACAGK